VEYLAFSILIVNPFISSRSDSGFFFDPLDYTFLLSFAGRRQEYESLIFFFSILFPFFEAFPSLPSGDWFSGRALWEMSPAVRSPALLS